MASQPHDKSDKHCSVCKKKFTKNSMTLSIRFRAPGFIERAIACGSCYEEKYGGGAYASSDTESIHK